MPPNESFCNFGRRTFKVNAFGSHEAQELALEKACDHAFATLWRYPDDSYARKLLQSPAPGLAGNEEAFGAYTVEVLRIGYASSSGREYESSYAAAKIEHAGPEPWACPDMQPRDWDARRASREKSILAEHAARPAAGPKRPGL